MFDWNDLKYFLAVARHGSTIAAGKALGTSQSTVHRRLEELERKLRRPEHKPHALGGPATVATSASRRTTANCATNSHRLCTNWTGFRPDARANQ